MRSLLRHQFWLCGAHGQGRVVVQLLAEPLRAGAFGRPAGEVQLRQLQVGQTPRGQPASSELAADVVAAKRKLAAGGLAAWLLFVPRSRPRQQRRPTSTSWSL